MLIFSRYTQNYLRNPNLLLFYYENTPIKRYKPLNLFLFNLNFAKLSINISGHYTQYIDRALNSCKKYSQFQSKSIRLSRSNFIQWNSRIFLAYRTETELNMGSRSPSSLKNWWNSILFDRTIRLNSIRFDIPGKF